MPLVKAFLKRNKYIKISANITITLILLFLLIFVLTDMIVYKSTQNRIYNSIKKIPFNKVGLLLGTSKKISKSKMNLYYQYRINATVQLFKAKKIGCILVSGDNSTKYYNEPNTIKKDLISEGIPSKKIYLDFAGFRTLDSIIRCKEIFGQNSFTIISQKFHNERAVYIAQKKGINAIGFNAQDVEFYYGLKIKIREKFARVKMILDLLFNKRPKFLGKKIKIK